jgi:fructan beta-fructosidase
MRLMPLLLLWCTLNAQYDQPYRPQVHFSPKQHWTNDPNGLVYFEGEYHLFFQYNPFGDIWGHMSWGHAVSKDLVHWQELPVALPEENGVMIFTGSTVVDEHNTSNFCLNNKPCLVAIYTGHTPRSADKPALQTQNLAYSNDRGRTWTKYKSNPVLNLNMSNFRDPAVFLSKEGNGWIMAVSLPDDHKVRFYRSPDLKSWKQVSEFGPAGASSGQWECPDLFPLVLDGNKNETRWVLKVGLNPGALQGGSGEQYFVGRFDGTSFVNENPSTTALWSDYGKDCYCALIFNNLPPAQTPVMLGWMNNWQYANKVPTSPWRGQMTIPRALALKTFPEGIRLVQRPVESIARQRDKKVPWQNPGSHSFMLEAAIPSDVTWRIKQPGDAYTLIGYDSTRHEVFVDRTHSGPDFPARTAAPLPQPKGTMQWQILVDRNSIEVFADNGRIAITNLFFPKPEPFQIEAHLPDGKPASIHAEAWTLKSIW